MRKNKRDNVDVKQYIHNDKRRINNPPVGLVTAETDHLNGKKTYKFDPHLEPQLQWAGKAEGISFDVDSISLHVHQRIDPLTIIQAVKKRELQEQQTLFRYFESSENNPPIREAIEFYKHSMGWTNRLLAGDSLLVMNSLLEKEGLSNKVQMIYIDPPYGIRYSSNFQPFINKREVMDGKDEDLTQEPEMIKAFRDAWELGIHSYLTYLRNNLLLARELLLENGSVFVQISDENVHLVRNLMDEIFGRNNFCSLITFRKKMMPMGSDVTESVSDYILWYCKDRKKVKTRPLFKEKNPEGDPSWSFVELPGGIRRKLTSEENNNHKLLPKGSKVFQSVSLLPAQYRHNQDFPFKLNGKEYLPPKNSCWKTDLDGMNRLAEKNRLIPSGDTLRYVLFHDDYPMSRITNLWSDTSGADDQRYVVQTNTSVIQRCILMTTDPGDMIFDPTCGSGTSAYVAEKWGRRWITCDTSRVAITIAKQRLMTSVFDYYEFAYPKDGVSGGFNYNNIQHATLHSIANDEPPELEVLYDQPIIDKSKKRISGPFTVEAVPSQRVTSFEEAEKADVEADMSIARTGETVRQNDWIDEILATGIIGKGGQKIEFIRVDSMAGTRWIHADAETKDGYRVAISFGPEYAPIEQRQVQLAVQETESLVPRPKMVIFAAFQFDPEAAKDIDMLKWPGVNVLKVQMNADLLTSDLKKKRASNESFWLIGQPDVEVKKQGEKYVVSVNGFDYYNTRTGGIESGDVSRIAMWELDTDYDGRSVYPRQIFFPMAGKNEGWAKLARNLKGKIDEKLMEKFGGNISLPFKLGDSHQIAIKIIDDRGIESLKIVRPYQKPTQHLKYNREIRRFELVQGRRPAGYVVASEHSDSFDDPGYFIELPLVSKIRERVDSWREALYPGITTITKSLLEHWKNPEREVRLFFCQIEAIETLIWLIELPENEKQGLDIPNDGSEFQRLCLKMATGSGKTIVMAMLIAWQILNKVSYPKDTRFSKNCLVIAPGLTVKRRLKVLDPYGDNNYYTQFDLIPIGFFDKLRKGNVKIINWHALSWETEEQVGRKKSVDKRGAKSDEAYVREVLRDMNNAKNIFVINDEAHHAWRVNPEAQGKYVRQRDLKDSAEEATIWIGGLDRIHVTRTILKCFDFSGTPFYPSGKKSSEEVLFGWIVSDFGLNDAIESGLVKTPRVVIRDDGKLTAKMKSRFYHIYNDHEVKADISRAVEPQEPLPDLVTNAYYYLGLDWLETLINCLNSSRL